MNKPSGFCLTIILAFLSSLCHQAPAFSKQYEVGSVYSYTYETSVLLNEPQAVPVSSSKDVGFRISLEVDLLPLWQNPSIISEQIMQLKVSIPKLAVKARQVLEADKFVEKPSKVENLESFGFYFLRDGGVIKKVFYDNKAQLSLLNVKKGIASLLQYQIKDTNGTEVDSSGDCEVFYSLTERNKVLKTKKNCKPSEPTFSFSHTNQVLNAVVLSDSKTLIELDPSVYSIIKRVEAIETHVLRSAARKSSGGVEVISRQQLQLKERKDSKTARLSGGSVAEAVKSLSESIGTSLVGETLSSTLEPNQCILCKKLKEIVSSFRKALSPLNLASQSSAIAFLRIIRKMRESDKDTIKSVLTDKKNSKILPQLLDIVAATQTIPSHNAAMSVLKFKDSDISLPERYLIGLSLNTHPLEFTIEDLLKLLKRGPNDEKLKETLVLTIAAMSNTFNKISKNKNIVTTVQHTLLSELKKCSIENCKFIYIRGLKNLESRATLPTLFQFAKSSQKKVAIVAMRALQTMPHHYIDDKSYKELERIVLELDAPHDSSVRVMAVEMLLRTPPSDTLIESLFDIVKNPDTRELNSLILGHLKDLSEKNQSIDQAILRVLRESQLNNYHILSQGGLSSVFSRSLTHTDDVLRASFHNMMEINGGLLKRSNVDVFVDVGESRMKLLSFGMFSGGLALLSGEEGKTGNEQEEANAGIEIALLNSHLRPYVFFTGQGELMGHVWSGTASERTTALQGSVLLQDHFQVVPLQNGLNVQLLLTGVVSYDFAGQIQISLWNRNAHSLVEVASATVTRGEARVDNAFVQTMIEFNVGFQSQLNFVSDMDFADDVMMCLKMDRPPFTVVDSLRKLEKIPGTSYSLRKYKRKSFAVPGRSYVMNRKNTDICNKMNNNNRKI